MTPESQEIVLVEIEDRIPTVTLNGFERGNALSRALYRCIPAVLLELDQQDEAEIMILTGSDPAFWADLDLKELSEPMPAGSNEGVRSGMAGSHGESNGQ